MPRYRITDPTTNKTITISGDSPPNEIELEEIFKSTRQIQSTKQQPWYQRVAETEGRIFEPLQKAAPYAPEFAKQISPLTEYPRRALQPAVDVGMRALEKTGDVTTESLAGSRIPILSNPEVAAGVGTAIKMAPDIAMAGQPLMSAGRAAVSGVKSMLSPVARESVAVPSNMLTRLGGREINAAAGIKPSTVLSLAGRKEPAETGYRLSEWMRGRGLSASRPGEIANKAIQLEEQYGQRVGNAISKIESAGIDTSVSADVALQPLVDKWAGYAKSALSEGKRKAVPFEQIYNDLSTVAKNNQGRLNLETIREKLSEVGEQLNGMTESNPRLPAYEELYGTLANVRDQMVQAVAEGAGNQGLRSELLSANKDYSTLMRIKPDIRRSAAKESTTRPSISTQSVMKGASSVISKSLGAVGRQLVGTEAAIAKGIPLLSVQSLKKPQLTREKAMEFIEQAKGELPNASVDQIKNRARELARENYSL